MQKGPLDFRCPTCAVPAGRKCERRPGQTRETVHRARQDMVTEHQAELRRLAQWTRECQ